jgi:hypothetical protein
LLCGLLSACSLLPEGAGLQPRPTATYYLPPTPAASAAPAGGEPQSAEPAGRAYPEPAATPACADGLSFLEDLTIPDGTPVEPGAELDKRWRVVNSGTCNWGEGYTLVLTAGPELGAAPSQALFPARGGAEAVIRLVFTAPEEPGTYRSAWQARSPDGLPFGDTIFLDIVVE